MLQPEDMTELVGWQQQNCFGGFSVQEPVSLDSKRALRAGDLPVSIEQVFLNLWKEQTVSSYRPLSK